MDKINEWIKNITGFNSDIQTKILISLFIVFILWLIRLALLRIVWRKVEESQTRYRWQKISAYIAALVGIFLIFRVWFEGVQSLATYLGLLSAGLAIALKDLISCLAGWLFIMWRNPISVGDRIQIGDYKGDVIDIRLFKFTLLEIGNWVDADQSTGRIIHIPNSMIITEALGNYTRGFQFIWNEIPVLLTFESNWEKAKTILKDIATLHAQHLTGDAEKRIKKANKKFMIFYKTLSPTVYTTVKDCGVMLTIRYLIEPRKRRSSDQAVWEDILKKFAKCSDIDFAYPTQRFYNNSIEGKDGTRLKSD